MNILLYLFNMTNLLVWCFPPIRQFRTKFFGFFLVTGLTDFIGFFFNKYVSSGTNHIVYIISIITALFTLLEKKYTPRYILGYLFLVITISGSFLYYQDIIISTLTLLTFTLLILGVLFKHLLTDFFKNKAFSIFIGVLIFYELTNLTKMATLLTGFTTNYVYFGTTTAIQILIGLFFSVYRYDYKRLILQFR